MYAKTDHKQGNPFTHQETSTFKVLFAPEEGIYVWYTYVHVLHLVFVYPGL